ncbi:MAG TPA: hypothetical protein VJJ20_01595 [Candidatus Paceibacterota bacterium]
MDNRTVETADASGTLIRARAGIRNLVFGSVSWSILVFHITFVVLGEQKTRTFDEVFLISMFRGVSFGSGLILLILSVIQLAKSEK